MAFRRLATSFGRFIPPRNSRSIPAQITPISRQLWTLRGRGKRLSLFGLAGGVTLGAGSLLYYYANSGPVACAETSTEEKEKKSLTGRASQSLPEYSLSEVAQHTSKADGGIWVTYGDGVYDITDFVDEHPGGSEKIMLAAGQALEPFWAVFAQHNTEQVREILEEWRIGNIHAQDRERKKPSPSATEGPYATDPTRSPILKINTREPFNAETPPVLLTDNYLTPNDIFFVRNHLPVPVVDPESYVLEISGEGTAPVKLTLDDLKTKFPKYAVTATIQCAGNRRADLAKVKPVKGIPWTGGAIGNAQWVGVRLRDVLLYAGFKEEESTAEHVHLEGLDNNPLTGDCYGASIPIEKAMDPKGDCLLVYEMNGAVLPRDHGYPIRALIPGTVGARNVKWLGRIVTSREEYGGLWQQRDYKGFSPSVDWGNVDFSKSPAIQELPVQSFICSPQNGGVVEREEEEVVVKGVAWSGGGRGIVRVDVSADGGETWHVAELREGTGQRRGRAWAWTFWEAAVPLPKDQREVEVCCKAVDVSYNVQPDTVGPIWNLRGCLSNAWHRVHITVTGRA